ncbi:triacylglycerol lipase [Saccharomonospora sp. NB11]|jgi:pimeloyl-ACP methyl ester carboxylesterase|uniref:esterase/lipase family protein n=1 Tax=Saccharomonospora sp. NB11 TaxID=1642298 RepID=UPI0018D0EFEF|nr:alpha/beta hydrolase [Saccharomonospora sp. NB11]
MWSSQDAVLVVTARMIPRLVRHPVWQSGRPDDGAGQGVLLVPGFGFGDWSLRPLRAWLRRRGYDARGTGTGLNLGCTTTLVRRIEHRLDELARVTGRRVIVVGQSRGGWLARIAAVRRPDLVRALVMLAAPVLDPLGVHTRGVEFARALARVSAWGVPGLLDADCLDGTCHRRNRALLRKPLPRRVPAVSVFSRRDAVVPWALCQDPCADCVEVTSSHTSMGLDPEVYVVLDGLFGRWSADPRPTPYAVR